MISSPKNLEDIHAACEEFDVDTLWVFGSAVRDDWVEGKSDVDFIAEFGESERTLFRQHMGFIGKLQKILGVRVDVLDLESIVGESIRVETLRTREILYERANKKISA